MLFWGPDNFSLGRVFTATMSAKVWVFTCQGWWKVRVFTHRRDFKTSTPNNNLVLLANPILRALSPVKSLLVKEGTKTPFYARQSRGGSAKGFMCMHVQLDRCSICSYHCWTGEVSVLISATTYFRLEGSLWIKSRAALPNTPLKFLNIPYNSFKIP